MAEAARIISSTAPAIGPVHTGAAGDAQDARRPPVRRCADDRAGETRPEDAAAAPADSGGTPDYTGFSMIGVAG